MVLGLLHSADVPYRRLEETIRSLQIPYLQQVGVRDRYVPPDSDKIKTTLGMWYQASDRSLTQEEVAGFHEGLARRLGELLPVSVIGSES